MFIYVIEGENKFSYNLNISGEVLETRIGTSQTVTSGKVLVLNQSYEPISVCSPKKALLLCLLMKAEIVEVRKGLSIRTISTSFQYPSVIRLSGYVKRPFKSIVLSRKNILRRDDFRCQYCGSKKSDLTIDHILPRSRGGKDTWENLVTACTSCNSKKGCRTPEEARMPLQSTPKKPNHIMFIRQYLGIADENWKQFLFI